MTRSRDTADQVNRIDSSAADATAITIDSSENVGIGDNSPSRALSTKSSSVTVGSFESTSASGGLIGFVDSNTTNDVMVRIGSLGNNLVLQAGGSERMRIDSAGAVTMPSQPAFSAINNTGGQNNIAPNTDHTVVFGGEIFDQGSDFTNNTFTAPVTGRYQFNVKIRLYQLDTAATYYQSILVTSNRSYELALLSPKFTSDPEYFTFTTSILADMDASDSAYVQIYQHLGSAQTDLQYGDTIFSGYLVA